MPQVVKPEVRNLGLPERLFEMAVDFLLVVRQIVLGTEDIRSSQARDLHSPLQHLVCGTGDWDAEVIVVLHLGCFYEQGFRGQSYLCSRKVKNIVLPQACPCADDHDVPEPIIAAFQEPVILLEREVPDPLNVCVLFRAHRPLP